MSVEFSRWILWALRGPINFGPKLKSTEEHMACWAGFRGKKTKENEDFKQISYTTTNLKYSMSSFFFLLLLLLI